jgi:hypothetical protein
LFRIRVDGYLPEVQVWQVGSSAASGEAAITPTFDDRRPRSLVLRAIFLVVGAGVFLILMGSMASALDAPDATGTVADTTEVVADTTEAVADSSDAVTDTTGTVADTTGTVADTTDAATGIVNDVATSAAGTTETVADVTRNVVGTAGRTVEGGVALLDGVVDGALAEASGSLDPVGASIDALLPGLGETADGISIPDLSPSDTTLDPAERSPGTGPSEPPSGSTGPRRRTLPGTAAITTTDVHLTPTGALRPDDPGGAVPGRPSDGGLPWPLDVAAAMLRGLAEAGGSGLVLWALIALLGLLPVLDDRWLRLVHPVSPRAPLVALDGRPG